MKINVTQKHIEKGKPCISTHCPIALALREQTGKIWRVIHYRAFRLRGGFVKLPPRACKFYKSFDSGEKVKPFIFNFPLEVA